MKHSFILNKTYQEWPEAFISEAELRKLGNISDDTDLYLMEQGQDNKITKDQPVDLARSGVEQIYSLPKEKYQFIINGRLLVSPESFVTTPELRHLGKIAADDSLYFKVEGADRLLSDKDKIDLKPYPIEEFYSVSPKLVEIKINDKSYRIKPGKYSVTELKKIGHVDAGDVLEQVVDGKLTPLPDNASVLIKGCEVFFSHKPDGTSS